MWLGTSEYIHGENEYSISNELQDYERRRETQVSLRWIARGRCKAEGMGMSQWSTLGLQRSGSLLLALCHSFLNRCSQGASTALRISGLIGGKDSGLDGDWSIRDVHKYEAFRGHRNQIYASIRPNMARSCLALHPEGPSARCLPFPLFILRSCTIQHLEEVGRSPPHP